jgi:hypothetical protein
MLDKIKNGLKNFAHNLLNITDSLFRTGLLVGGIVLCVFYSAPFIPVLCYGFILGFVASLLFSAAHRVVDFFANMFSDGNTAQAKVEVTSTATNTPTAENTVSSTSVMQTAFAKNPAPKQPKVVDASAQTESKTKNTTKKISTATVAANQDEETADAQRAVSFK